MVIRKINNVFEKHHRVLFGLIVAVVIVTFVFYFSTGSIFDVTFSSGQKSGLKVFGEDVLVSELQEQVNCTVLQDVMRMGGYANQALIERSHQIAYNYAPINIAKLSMAKQRGIDVTSEEIDSYLVKFFVDESGKFSQEVMNNFNDSILAPLGMDMNIMRESVRRQMIISRLDNELVSTIIVTDTEGLDAQFDKFSKNLYTVAVTEYSAEKFMADAVVSDAEIAAYYEANQAEFEIPAEYVADVVFFSYENPNNRLKAAEMADSEANLISYFDYNMDKYSKIEADGQLIAPEFAQVKDQVTDDYIDAEAINLTSVQADAFATRLYELFDTGKATRNEFLNIAKAENYQTITTKQFSKNSVGIQFANGVTINNKDFVNDMTSTSTAIPLSNVLPSESGLYLAYVTRVKEESVQSLDSVKEVIINKLKSGVALNMARSAAKEAGITFDSAKTAEELANKSFYTPNAKYNRTEIKDLALEGSSDLANSGLITLAASILTINETSQAMDTADGAILVTLLAQSSSEATEETKANYLRDIYSAAGNDTQRYILANIQGLENYFKQQD